MRSQELTERRRRRWTGLVLSAANSSISLTKFNLLFQMISTLAGAFDNIMILWLGIDMVMNREMTIGAFVRHMVTQDPHYSLNRTYLSKDSITLLKVISPLKSFRALVLVSRYSFSFRTAACLSVASVSKSIFSYSDDVDNWSA
ncbi:TPA: hypothetical protein I3798_003021 [Enterobacter cloacae]|nr:hypothetical protein [Enterobacter cloacae]HAS1119615.1 hypothetical protein [Enterobacter cloacae]HAS1133036.1 hypothetical protein [Enterobacter cloacae]HCJ7367809.1 hypothetical protein [Enterobacter hormaechei subsp. xiangfangensis]